MTIQELIAQQARDFFETQWQRGDPWQIESSEYEWARCVHLLRMLEGRRYARTLEIGCGAGYFTHLLAGVAEPIVALDISPTAIARARTLWTGPMGVDFRVANIMEYDVQADGPWALVVLSDTICMLGWLYPFFDVAWLAARLFAASTAGGRLLLANSMCESNEPLLLPWLIRTYRDLFRNVGYDLEAEEIFRGNKQGVDFEVLISLFAKGPESGP
jgi:SAM-dependent methyltransferase